MNTKSNKNNLDDQFIHKVGAGVLPYDESIELFADRNTRKVFYISNGLSDDFANLSPVYKRKLYQKLCNDPVAYETLKNLPYTEALERFAYCVYGTLDHVPDITSTGTLGNTDNFRCNIKGCNCTEWASKKITYNGKLLNGRMLDVLNAYRKGREDKHVCTELGIAPATLNTHKKKLFDVFGVHSKTELVIAAIIAKIIN